MAGDNVLMSPVSMMMIHNPATVAFGDHTEMAKAIEMLEGVKDSIINAYSLKTGMSRAKLSRLMDAETWMDATKAVELGFDDDIITKNEFQELERLILQKKLPLTLLAMAILMTIRCSQMSKSNR